LVQYRKLKKENQTIWVWFPLYLWTS